MAGSLCFSKKHDVKDTFAFLLRRACQETRNTKKEEEVRSRKSSIHRLTTASFLRQKMLKLSEIFNFWISRLTDVDFH